MLPSQEPKEKQSLTLLDSEQQLLPLFHAILDLQDSNNDPNFSDLPIEEQQAIEQAQYELIFAHCQAAQDKRDQVAKLLMRIDERVDNIGTEIKRLHAMRERLLLAKERFESYVLQVMQQLNIKKMEGNVYDIVRRKLPDIVAITDYNQLTDEWFYQPPIPAKKPDKKKIKEALEQGDKVEGAEMMRNREGVRIK